MQAAKKFEYLIVLISIIACMTLTCIIKNDVLFLQNLVFFISDNDVTTVWLHLLTYHVKYYNSDVSICNIINILIKSSICWFFLKTKIYKESSTDQVLSKQRHYKPFHPNRPVWYVPDQGIDYTILDS